MKKRNLLILMLSLVVVFVATIISVGVAYAADYDANIAYLYNTSVSVPEIEVSTVGNTITIADTDASNKLKLSKYDLVIEADKKPFSSLESTKYYIDSLGTYHIVYQNLNITTYGTLTNDTSATISYIKAIPSECKTSDAIITYNNSYVSSNAEFDLVNFGRGTNQSFLLFSNKKKYANTVYLLNNITIDEEKVMTSPCSIDTLNSTITLNDKLTLRHGFAGNFYIKGTIVNTNRFTLNAPNARYYLYGSLEGETDATIVTNGDTYDTLIEDSLDYIEELIPTRIYEDSISLYNDFMMYSVKYTYQIAYETTPGVYGAYSDMVGGTNINTILARGTSTKKIKIKVTASDGTNSDFREIESKIIGTNVASLVDAISSEIDYSYKNKQVKSIDIYGALESIKSYFGNYSITLTLNDGQLQDAYFDVSNKADHSLNEVTITRTGNTYSINSVEITSLQVHKGLINLNNETTLKVSNGGNESTCNLHFIEPNIDEIKSYISENIHIVMTDKAYNLLNVHDEKIYNGTTLFINKTFDIESINCLVVNANAEDCLLSDYFIVNQTEGINTSIQLKTDIEDMKNCHLAYDFVLDDGSSFRIKTPIGIVSSGNAGEQSDFKSNNPFDDVFSQSDTNWLIGTDFDFKRMTNYSSSYYAKIEIVSIDGDNYTSGTPINRSETHNGTVYNYDISKIISIVGDNDTKKIVSDGSSVYRSLDIGVDINYVPSRDILVLVKCTAYDGNEISVQQEYTITIPGILKCTGDTYATDSKTGYSFVDRDFYDMTLSVYAIIDDELVDPLINTYAEDYYYLLAKAINHSCELDYTQISKTIEGTLNIQGLEELSSVTSVNLSGYPIGNLSSLRYASNNDLVNLSLSNCSLTDAILYEDSESNSYLYSIYLENVDLSNNNITRTNGLLYRTVNKLNISSQGNLISVEGIALLTSLIELNVSGNKIFNFEFVKDMTGLQKFICYNNVIAGSSIYGSSGSINLPIYVWMMKTNDIKIYAYEQDNYLVFSDETGTNNISTNVMEACIALNSVVVPTSIYSNETFNMNLPIYGEAYSGYKRIGRASTNGITSENCSSYYYINSSGEYVQGESSTYKSTLVYYSLIQSTYTYSLKYTNLTNQTRASVYLIDENHQVVSSLNGSVTPKKASFIISYLDSTGTLIASREFIVTINYNYSA